MSEKKVVQVTWLNGEPVSIDSVTQIEVQNENGFLEITKENSFDNTKVTVGFNMAAIKTYVIDHNPRPMSEQKNISKDT